jgi:hypothetical protein
MVTEVVKKRLREQYRTLDPVALLAEIRAAQEELGNRIDRRAGGALRETAAGKSDVAAPAAFARGLGNDLALGEPRATHRQPKRHYKKRVRMPSKLDPHAALIEGWLTAEPQLTAIAIVGRLAERHPEQFGNKQHSIVQRLLRALRRGAAHRLIAETATVKHENLAQQPPGAVDGSGYGGPDPPTAPLHSPGLNVDPSPNVLQPPAW